MDTGIISAITGVACTVISSIVTFFLTRRKYNTEVDSQQIKNMREAFETYKEMMEQTVDTLNRKVDELQRENDTLRAQFNQMQTQMVNLLMGEKLGINKKRSKKDE